MSDNAEQKRDRLSTTEIMMTEMIKRIAKAIGEVSTSMNPYRTDQDLLEACARAAIEAMGEPTAEMMKGGMETLEEFKDSPLEVLVGRVWWEMICIAQPAAVGKRRGQ